MSGRVTITSKCSIIDKAAADDKARGRPPCLASTAADVLSSILALDEFLFLSAVLRFLRLGEVGRREARL